MKREPLNYILGYKKIFILTGIITLVHFAISFFTDKVAFRGNNSSLLKYLVLKGLFFVVLFFVWFFIINFIVKIKDGNQKYINWAKIAICFFVIYSVIMILIWPGNWIWDEIVILEKARNLELFPWHHFLTSFFYIFSMMIMPFPAFIVITQYAIITFIVGYIISVLQARYGNKAILIGLFFIIPPILANVFYPMRLILYSFIELLFIILIITNMKNGSKVDKKTLIIIMILNVLLSVWRTEGIFLIVVLPIALIIKKYKKKTILLISVIMISIATCIIGMQSHLSNNYDRNSIDYSVTGIVLPYHDLLKTEYKENHNSQIINSAKQYLNINEVNKYSRGETAFWADVYSRVDNGEKFKKMIGDYKSLIMKRPQAFIKNRVECLLSSQQLYNKNGKIISVVHQGNTDQRYRNIDDYTLGRPISRSIREKTLNCFYAKTGISFIDILIKYSYNLVIPLVILILMAIFSLIKIKKRAVLFVIAASLLIQFFAIFITAPATFFMYYLPIYVCAYMLLFIYLLDRKEKQIFS